MLQSILKVILRELQLLVNIFLKERNLSVSGYQFHFNVHKSVVFAVCLSADVRCLSVSYI